ncbi:MAG: hypothetical protein ACWIPJ_07235 [Polaribacter sp.]
MKNISLKIDDIIFGQTEEILSKNKKSRNRYINEALNYYNKLQRRLYLEKTLKAESNLVSEESNLVLTEFEKFELDD